MTGSWLRNRHVCSNSSLLRCFLLELCLVLATWMVKVHRKGDLTHHP